MKLTNISVIKDVMQRHGFEFTKSLGQNFLINPSVCPRMAETVSGTVVEIGAGVGVLTRELSRTADKVIVIEIDRSLEPILSETLRDCDNVEIIWGDVTKLDFPALLTERGIKSFEVCANLPYYIAANVIMTLLESELPIRGITAMVQEEVAKRFTALPCSKLYGAVSVAARFYSEPKLLFRVSRGSFIPAPNVDSAVIRFDVFDQPKHDVDKMLFIGLVKAAFSERRKQLANPVAAKLCLDKKAVQAALAATGKEPTARAEDLSVNDFAKLYGELYVNISNRNLL